MQNIQSRTIQTSVIQVNVRPGQCLLVKYTWHVSWCSEWSITHHHHYHLLHIAQHLYVQLTWLNGVCLIRWLDLLIRIYDHHSVTTIMSLWYMAYCIIEKCFDKAVLVLYIINNNVSMYNYVYNDEHLWKILCLQFQNLVFLLWSIFITFSCLILQQII